MVTVLLHFIYSFRADNWHLYLESIRNKLMRVFAYGRFNFALCKYEFLNGNFAVLQSMTNTFGKLEPNKVIETTISKDTKSPAGITGTSNKGLSYLNASSI